MQKQELTPAQIKPILKYVIQNNIELASNGIKPKSYCITGNAGIAKTSLCFQLAEELNMDVVELKGGQFELSDLIGYPVVENQISSIDGEMKWVTKEVLNDYLLQGFKSTGEHRMAYSKPYWIAGRDMNTPIVFIADDYLRNLPMVLQALMNITDKQEYMSWKLPKGSTVLLTANPSNGDFIQNEDDDAAQTRYLSLFMKPCVDSWAQWATNNVKECFINFLDKNKEIIEGTQVDEKGGEVIKGNLRSWTNYFQTIANIDDLSKDWFEIALPLGSGSLPQEHLILLHQFIKDKLDTLPTAADILSSTDIDKTIKGLEKVTRDRRDIAALLTKRLYNYALVNYKKYTPDMLANYIKVLENDNVLSVDLVTINIKNLCKYMDLTKSPILLNKILS